MLGGLGKMGLSADKLAVVPPAYPLSRLEVGGVSSGGMQCCGWVGAGEVWQSHAGQLVETP